MTKDVLMVINLEIKTKLQLLKKFIVHIFNIVKL